MVNLREKPFYLDDEGVKRNVPILYLCLQHLLQ